MSDAAPAYLVFGAYGGIGSSLARILADRGTRLALSGRNRDRLDELARELDAAALPADAADFGAVESTVTETVDRFGRLDGVVNCAGSILLKPAHLTRPQEWFDTLETNLTTAFAIVRAGTRALMEGDGGSIVLVSTAAASIGLPNHESIAAAKGGIDALVRSAAATYGARGVRVNAVAPGLVDTPLAARITRNDKARERSEAMHALGRIGTPDDVAEAIDWLLSDRTSWVTGQVLGVDGGLGRVRSD